MIETGTADEMSESGWKGSEGVVEIAGEGEVGEFWWKLDGMIIDSNTRKCEVGESGRKVGDGVVERLGEGEVGERVGKV